MESLGGYCKTPNLFIKSSNKPDPLGILSENIFGPINSYQCSCGNLRSKTLDAGKTCQKCGVYCGSNELRLTTFGKIKTVFNFIKTTKKNKIIKIIGKDYKQLIDPIQADANAAQSRYIGFTTTEIKLFSDLKSIKTSGYSPIPFRITGIFSLIFVLKYIYNSNKHPILKDLFEDKWTDDEILILPPDIRPIFRDTKNNNTLIRVEVNDFYISILNLNKRNELLQPAILSDCNTWTDLITFNTTNNLEEEEIVESMSIEYDRLTSLYQYYIDQIYAWSFNILSGKQGLIRSSILSRTVEFSARAVVIVDPQLPAHEIKVSKFILYKLWMPYFLNYVSVRKKIMDFDEAFYKVATKGYLDNKKLFDEFCDWFTTSEEAKQVIPYKECL